MDGDDASDACLAESHGELAREAVIDGDTIALQVGDNTAGAPPRLAEGGGATLGIAELGTLDDLTTEVVATFVGGIEAQLHVAIAQADEVVDKGAAIAAESRAIAHDALSINTYYHGSEE